jgi:hypothetical protein
MSVKKFYYNEQKASLTYVENSTTLSPVCLTTPNDWVIIKIIGKDIKQRRGLIEGTVLSSVWKD